MANDIDVFLAHYGVKGMKWGVRKDRKSGGSRKSSGSENTSSNKGGRSEAEIAKSYMDIPSPKLTKKQQLKAGAENQKKFLAKAEIDPSDSPSTGKKEGWRPTKKQVAYGVAGAAAVGFLFYASYEAGKKWPPGTEIDLKEFTRQVTNSKFRSWFGQGYLTEQSFAQQEFTLPAGHTFHRISTKPEDIFKSATYATSSVEDFNRYVAAFRGEKAASEFHHVTFKSTKEIKIPSLVTRLETTREVLAALRGKDVSEVPEADAKAEYVRMTGGSWSDNTAQSLMLALKKKGYDGIIDDMDAGVIGDQPLVLFGNDAFTAKSSRPLTPEDIRQAESSLIELAARK